MQMQVIELVTRQINYRPESERASEIVVGVLVNGAEAVLPMGSKVKVESAAGEGLQTVTIEMFADRVRYITEQQAKLQRQLDRLGANEERPEGDAPAR